MGKSRILVLQLKEIIYTAIFLLFGILLILVVVIMFKSDDETKDTMSSATQVYTPGIYTSEFALNGNTLSIQVTVDEATVKNVEFIDIDDSVKKMYPLLETSLDDIVSQLKSGTDISQVSITNDTMYTHKLLINAINDALSEAKY